jgi:hypothetical protein
MLAHGARKRRGLGLRRGDGGRQAVLSKGSSLRYFQVMNASAPILPNPHKVGLRVEDFLLLNDSGAFDAYGKTELIDGDIYVMNAQHSPHARAKSRLHVALANRL